MLGLGSTLTKVGKIGLPIVTDNLVLQHKYIGGEVHQVSAGAAYFDGTNDYIDTSNHFSSTFDGDFSIAAWVKPIDGRPSSQVNIVGAVDGSTDQISVVLMDTGQIQFYMSADGDNGYVNSSVVFADGVDDWTHVACVAALVTDGETTMKIYINGVEDNSASVAMLSAKHDDFAISETLYIGARNTNSTTDDFFKGYICNVGIWGAALSQAEIKSIMWKNYADLTSAETTSMVSWWNLDTAYDSNDGAKEITLDNHYAGNASSEGSELITNGNFSTGDLTGWSTSVAGDGVTPVYTTVNGTTGVRISSVSGGNSLIYQGVMTSGKFYNISYTILENNNGELSLEDDSSDPIPSTVGDHSIKYYFVDGDSSFVLKRRTGATDIVVTNISVKEINGNTGILS